MSDPRPAPFDVVLVEPEIPPNTGNVLRLAANTGVTVHLVRPLGFTLDDRRFRRAGLDHVDRERLVVHAGFEAAVEALAGRRGFAMTTRGTTRHDRVDWAPGDVLWFGPETRGLSDEALARFPDERRVRIAQLPASRSLNLSNAVAITVYEAWRRVGFG